ncbi:MAG: HlyD family efflux transporter periplasmic adaptor subunit [Saprospiraceae bacterium]|nr:HlyD family efflux transporter periplasmic adaptor subunit [Saprospiraceae bacterium]
MTSTKKSFFAKYWIWLLSAIALALIVFAVIKSKSKPKGTEVIVEKVSKRNIVETVTASGKIYPEKEIKISSDVSGEVVALYVKEGDSVKVGQILARVNPDAYQSALERGSAGVNTARSQSEAVKTNIQAAKAQRDQVRSQYDNAVKNLERSRSMYKEGIISKADFETAETSVANLKSNLESAEANIESSKNQANASGYQVKDAEAMFREQRTNLERTIIKAPASGIISKLNVEKGERVVGTIQMSGTEMMRIADLNAMEVQVEVSENDIIRVKTGDQATIEVDAYSGRRFTGQVTEISNSASNINTGGLGGLSTDQVTKFLVKVRINKDSYEQLITGKNSVPFKPGMSATVEIKTSTREAVLSIPIQAVTAYDAKQEENKKKEKLEKESSDVSLQKEEKLDINQNDFHEAVFVKIGDTVSRIDVVTGIQDQNYIEIIKGLEEGSEIVTGPYSAISKDLKSGKRVRIKVEKENNEKKD